MAAKGGGGPWEIWWRIKDSVPAAIHNQHYLKGFYTEDARSDHLKELNPDGVIEFILVDPDSKKQPKKDGKKEVVFDEVILPKSGKLDTNTQGSLF